ncbi:MAG TPA: hypothetical protein VGD79_07385 [Thermoanaerobaculia bacterium]|jgi:hypothetical protein
MSFTFQSRSVGLALFAFVLIHFPAHAAPQKNTRRPAPAVASDGTVTGNLSVNGEKFKLTHVYGRKREAWPADAKALGAGDVEELSCGIVDLIFTNAPLSEATLAAILQNEYRGSDEVRGVRLVIDGTGKYKFEKMFLLESGAVVGFGMTQTNGSINAGRRYTGNVSSTNEEVTQVRMFDVSFDTAVKVQYSRTETEGGERIPESRLTEEFLKTLPGEWRIERWLGLGCTVASGKLVVGERSSPHAFSGMFHLTLSTGEEIDEDVTISLAGNRVHFDGGKVSLPSAWGRDVFDLELWQDLMIGNNDTDFVVLRKD